MTIELNEREVNLLVQSLRGNEKNSRKGFADWMARNLDTVGDATWTKKTVSAVSVYKELVALRAKLGDSEPVKIN